jgi:hypothetical protein
VSKKEVARLVVVDPVPMQVRPEAVYRQLGYPRTAQVPDRVLEEVATSIREAGKLMEPRGTFRLVEDDDLSSFEHFTRARRVVVALVTIGPSLERKASAWIRSGRFTEGLALDTIGSIASECAADHLESRIRKDFAAAGFKLSRRYSPGYCGWELKAQKQLFDFFSDTRGISLTESCMMVPEKSLSFAVALSENGDFSGVEIVDCNVCDEKDACQYRHTVQGRTRRGDTDTGTLSRKGE